MYFTVAEKCEAVSVPAAHTARLDRASVADRRLTRGRKDGNVLHCRTDWAAGEPPESMVLETARV